MLDTASLLSEFQTAGAVQQKARSAKWVLVVGLCSKGVSEKRRRREIWRHLMWRATYAGVDERRILNVSTASLYSIRWRTGSQCNCSSSGRACVLLGDCVTITRVAAVASRVLLFLRWRCHYQATAISPVSPVLRFERLCCRRILSFFSTSYVYPQWPFRQIFSAYNSCQQPTVNPCREYAVSTAVSTE